MTGTIPYKNLNNIQALVKRIVLSPSMPDLDSEPGFPSNSSLRNLMHRCWERDHAERLTIEECRSEMDEIVSCINPELLRAC